MASEEAEIVKDIIGRDGYISLVDALSLSDRIDALIAEIPDAYQGIGPDGYQAIMIKKEKIPRKIGDPLLKYT